MALQASVKETLLTDETRKVEEVVIRTVTIVASSRGSVVEVIRTIVVAEQAVGEIDALHTTTQSACLTLTGGLIDEIISRIVADGAVR